jgi:hypothetical protein
MSWGVLNVAADLLSTGNPLKREWKLHPQVVKQMSERYGQASVELFAAQENVRCPLFFALAGDAPLGLDTLAHPWSRVLLYAFPLLSLLLPHSSQSEGRRLIPHLGSPSMALWVWHVRG